MRMSLEEERRALLEEIEARRSLYRRILRGETKEHQTTGTHRQFTGRVMPPQHKRLGQWLLDHPLLVATSVALLVWVGPRLLKRIQRTRMTVAKAPVASQRTNIPKAFASLMMLFLRDPRHLQTTASMLRNTWRWLRHTSSAQTHNQGRKPHA